MSRLSSWLLVAGSLLLLLTSVGFLLPSRRAVERSARYATPVGELWGATTDFAGQARWRQAIDRVQALADRNGNPGYRELGPGLERTYAVTVFVAPRHLELCFDDPERWFAKTWSFELQPEGDGTRISITEKSQVENALGRLARHVLGDGGDELELFLVELGRLFGEDVHPEAAPPEREAGLDFLRS